MRKPKLVILNILIDMRYFDTDFSKNIITVLLFLKKRILVLLILLICLASPIYAQVSNTNKLVVQLGHSGEVKSAIFSPDGKLIASNGDGEIIIWQFSTGREIIRIPGIFSSIDFAPDSKSIVAAESDGEFLDEERKLPFYIEIFNVSNGKLVKRFPTHKNKINSVKFSNDGNLILTSSDDHTAKLWNTADGTLKKTFASHKTEVSYAVFSPDNKFIAASGVGNYSYPEKKIIRDSTAIIWDAVTGKEEKKIIHQDIQGSFEGIGFLQFSPNGEFLITSAKPYFQFSYDAVTIRMWNCKTGELFFRFVGKGPVAFSPDGKYLLADIADKINERGFIEPEFLDGIELIDLENGKIISRFYDYASMCLIGGLSFSPDGKYALMTTGTIHSGGNAFSDNGEDSLRVFEIPSGKEVYNLGGNIQRIEQLSISKDEKYILVGDYLWSLENGNHVELENFIFKDLEKDLENGYYSHLPPRIFSADGKVIAESISSEDDNGVSGFQLWNVETGQEIKKIKTSNQLAKAYIPSNNKLLITESGGSVCSYRISDAEKVWCIDTADNYPRSTGDTGFYEISKDEKTIFIRNRINSLIAVDISSGRIIWNSVIEMHRFIPSIFISGNKFVIVPIQPDNTDFLSFIDAKSGKEVFRVEAQDAKNTNIENILLAYQVSKQRNVFIDKNTGQIIGVLPKEFDGAKLTDTENSRSAIINYFTGLEISKDFNKVLVAYGDLVEIIDLKSGNILKKFRGHTGYISVVRFLNDENYVISASLDGTTKLWDVKTGKELCSLISFDDGTWFVTAPDGRFDTNNLDSNAKIHWMTPDDPLNPLPVEIFMRDYFEPKLLSRILSGEKLPPIRDLSKLNRSQPRINIKNIKETALSGVVDITVEAENVISKNQRNKVLESGIYDLKLFCDGQLIGVSTPKEKLEKLIANTSQLINGGDSSNQSINTEEVKAWRETNDIFQNKKENIKFISPTKIEYTFRNIRLPRDGRKEVDFTAYAFNSDKVKSVTTPPFKFTIPMTVSDSPQKGKAFLVTIGVNASETPDYNLRYAVNDARKMQQIVGERLKNSTEKYSEIIQIPLISDYDNNNELLENTAQKAIIKSVFSLLSGNEKAVSQDILRQIPNYEQISQIEPEDTLIITFSGHGYANNIGDFYILPFDIGQNSTLLTPEVLQKAISSAELSLWMQDITATEMIMIIDACYSSAAVQGNGFKPGPMGSRGLGQLAYDKDMKILSATQANNVAIETGSLQQGLLSYALLQDGINKSEADADKDKKLLSTEWLMFAEKRVPELYQAIKDGKLNLIVDGKTVTGEKGIELAGNKTKKGNLNLQEPTLFDFKRRNIRNTLFSLP